MGAQALYSNTTASNNTAVGYKAGYATTGANNTFVGYVAGESVTTGASNVLVGYQVANNLSTGSNNICLGDNSGRDAQLNLTTESNRFVAGNNAITNAYVKVAWTVTSDARDKTNIVDLDKGLSFVEQLQPKQYQFKVSREDATPTGKLRYGFLAQDILALEGNNPVIIDNEFEESLKYNGESLVPILVKAIQELKAEVDSLKQQLGK
jgi:hypothetical protein